MAGFSSTVKPVGKPPRGPKPPFGVVGSSLPQPPKAYNVSGYFNAAGQPTFAQAVQSPPVAQAISKSLASQGPQAPGQSPGTSGTQTSGSSGSSSGGSGSGAPLLDATALNNIAENQFKANNSINTIENRSIPNLQTNLAATLAQLGYQQPRDQLKLEQGANRRGALYSSAYNQDLGDLNHNYLTRGNTATTAEGQQEQGLKDQVQAILGGIPLYNQGQANASVQRAIAAAAANPATGQPPSLTPEQVKYIKAGLAGGKTSGGGSSPKVSGTITDRGPFKRTSKGILPRPKPKPPFGPVGTSGF